MKTGRIFFINLIPSLLVTILFIIYIILLYGTEMNRSAGSGRPGEMRNIQMFTMWILLSAAVIFIFTAVRNMRTELSREKIKNSFNIIDERFQNFIESTSDGFIYIDRNGVITADPVITSKLGYTEEEMSRLSPYSLINSEIDGEEILNHIRTASNEITGRYEARLVKKDGSLLEVLFSASRIDTGAMKGLVFIVKDMSEESRSDAARIDVQNEYSIIELQSALQYIYQNAGSMMDEPLIVSEDSSIISTVEKMNDQHKNTFVVVDEHGFASGIVTDQDLRMRIISGAVQACDSVRRIMSSPVVTAPVGIMFFEAFRLMRDRSIRQLVIVDDESMPVGILTEKKLLQVQSTNPAVLFEELKDAETAAQLRDCYQRLKYSVRTLILSGAKAVHISGVVSKTAEIITLKLIENSIAEYGPPPCRFAFLAMGSEGRGEQTLITDQDNAIIFSDASEDKLEEYREYFLKLGKNISDSLNYIGYKYCAGGVMASNPRWVRSESEWHNQFWEWVSGEGSSMLLDINIIFDFKRIYGDLRLSNAVRSGLWETANRFPSFIREMAAAVSEFKPPLTVFGNIKVKYTDTHDEVFDIKKALGPLIIYARTMSLRERISETSTLARLKALRERGVIPAQQYRNFVHAFEYLTLLRLREQIKAVEKGEAPDNYIHIDDLVEVEILTLRKIFKQIYSAQEELGRAFTAGLR